MKIIKGVLLITLLVGLVVGYYFATKVKNDMPAGVFEGLNVPDFTVYDSAGKPLRLSELKGTALFVNFWATWCKSCVEEMPALNALYKLRANDKRLRFITILYNDKLETALDYLKKNGFELPVYTDADTVTARTFGITGVPETYLIDKDGILRRKIIGPMEWDKGHAASLIDSLVGR